MERPGSLGPDSVWGSKSWVELGGGNLKKKSVHPHSLWVSGLWQRKRKREKEKESQTCLVVQWLRIQLPIQRTWVQTLVKEDSKCFGQLSPYATATEPAL